MQLDPDIEPVALPLVELPLEVAVVLAARDVRVLLERLAQEPDVPGELAVRRRAQPAAQLVEDSLSRGAQMIQVRREAGIGNEQPMRQDALAQVEARSRQRQHPSAGGPVVGTPREQALVERQAVVRQNDAGGSRRRGAKGGELPDQVGLGLLRRDPHATHRAGGQQRARDRLRQGRWSGRGVRVEPAHRARREAEDLRGLGHHEVGNRLAGDRVRHDHDFQRPAGFGVERSPRGQAGQRVPGGRADDGEADPFGRLQLPHVRDAPVRARTRVITAERRSRPARRAWPGAAAPQRARRDASQR